MSRPTVSSVLKKVYEKYRLVKNYDVLAWGNEWHFYEPQEEVEEVQDKKIRSLDDLDSIKDLKKFEKDGLLPKDQETDDAEVKQDKLKNAAKNPPEVEKAHQTAVLKSRKLHDKLTALEKVQDPEFLKKLILSKAHKDVKEKAASKLEREEDAKELFLARRDDISDFPSDILSDLLKDESFIVENFQQIETKNALAKVKDEKKVADLIIKYGAKLFQNHRYWYGHRQASVVKIMDNIKDQKILSKLGMMLKADNLSELSYSIALKSNDQKVLSHILQIEGGTRQLEDAKAIALYKLKDKDVGKKIANEILNDAPTFSSSYYHGSDLAHIALSITEDQSLLVKYAVKAPEIALPKIKDKNKIKEIAEHEPKLWDYIDDDKWKKEQYEKLKDAHYSRLEALEQIKDKKYVMEEALNGAFLIKSALKQFASNQDFLKQYFEKTKNSNALSFIKDVDYLEGLLKKEKKSTPREEIIKSIDDPEVLLKLLKKERGKGTRHVLIWKLRKHPEKIADYLLNYFHDTDTHEYGAKKLDKDTAFAILSGKLMGPNARYIPDATLVKTLSDDPETLIKLFNKDKDNENLRDEILKNIDEEDFVFKNTKPEDIDGLMLENIHKKENLYKIALVNKDIGHTAFQKIDKLSKEQYEELLLKAVDPKVRKAALPYVENKEALKEVLLTDAANGADALPYFKDNQKVLEEAFLKSKDNKVISNLAKRIKNQKVLEEYVLKASGWFEEGIAEKIIPKIKDAMFVRKIFSESRSQKIGTQAFENLIKDKSNHDFLVKSYIEKYLDSGRLFEGIKTIANQDDLKEIATKTGNESILEESFEELAKDKSNADFLVNLYLNKNYDLFGYRAKNIHGRLTGIVGPFLSKEVRLEQMSNPSMVNLLNLEDFKPTKEEAIQALSGSNPNELDDTKLVGLLKIAPEYAPTVWFNIKNERKGSVLPFLKADFVTEENVLGIAQAIKSSHHLNAIPQELIDKTYTLGNEQIQEALKGHSSESVLTENHKTQQQNKRFKYRAAQHSKNIPNPIKDQTVQHHAKDELFRLLVTLAR